MNNCFTTVYRYLRRHYKSVPTSWKGYTDKDLNYFVENEKRLLSKREHYSFFKSFCVKVSHARKDDIILNKTNIGVAINRFTYWIYNEKTKRIDYNTLDKDCMIMRIKNG